MRIPLRGHVQVRVAELGPTHVTLQTVEGHAISGAITFRIDPSAGRDYRFVVELFDRAASLPDWLSMTVLGERMQDATWRELVESVVTESGGTAAAGVQETRETVEGEAAARVYRWLEALAAARERTANARAIARQRAGGEGIGADAER